MSRFRQTIDILTPLLIFIAAQVVAGVAVGILAITGAVTNAFAWSMMVSDLLVMAAIMLLYRFRLGEILNVKTVNWRKACWGIVGTVACIFSLDVFEEFLDLPNLLEKEFTSMSHSLLGVLSIAVIGPAMEELVFRQATIGLMLKKGLSPKMAITLSVMLFGLIHLNPAQVPFAIAIGVIFGLIYYKTGNIVLTTLLHIANNSIAVWQMHMIDANHQEVKLTTELGGPVIADIAAIASLTIGMVCLYHFWKNYNNTITYETIS